MMLAVMYGMIPSAKIDSCRSAPPLNRLTRPSTPEALADGQTLLHRDVVDTGDRDERAQPEDRHDGDGEQQLVAQVRRTERPSERSEHDNS